MATIKNLMLGTAFLASLAAAGSAEAGTQTLFGASKHVVASSPADGLSHRCGHHLCVVESKSADKAVTMMFSSGQDKEGDEHSYRKDRPVYVITKAAPNIPSLELSLKLVSNYVADAYSADAVTKVSAALGEVSTASNRQYQHAIAPGASLLLTITNEGLIYVIKSE